MEAVSFLPEITFRSSTQRKLRLAQHLFLLPDGHVLAQTLRNRLESLDHKLESGGMFLYFNGDVIGDGTLYEIFQSYAHALTFYYEGRVTCRAIQEIQSGVAISPELFIDEEDRFGVTIEDKRDLLKKDLRVIEGFYGKISTELRSKNFNPIINMLEFFGMYLQEMRPKARLLFLNICLESLILGENEMEGVGFKLALRCANFLHSEDRNVIKAAIFEQVNTAYNLRSRIIHGANYEKAKNKSNVARSPSFESDHINEVEKILKRICRIILADENYYRLALTGKLGRELDRFAFSQ